MLNCKDFALIGVLFHSQGDGLTVDVPLLDKAGGRTGGDEFILFLKDINSEEILEREAARFAKFFHSFKAGEYVKYSATSSIGATVYPRDAKDYHGLYTTADSALYEAKRQGKNRMVFYNKDLENVNPDKNRETPIESDMRKE